MELSIEKRGNTLGRLVAEGLEPSEDRVQAENEIVCLYAGAAGELIKDARRVAVVRMGAKSDDQQAEAIMTLWSLARSKRQRNALTNRLRKRAVLFVRKHWGEVTALAGELLLAETLDSEEAGLVIDGAAGDAEAATALAHLRALKSASLGSTEKVQLVSVMKPIAMPRRPRSVKRPFASRGSRHSR